MRKKSELLELLKHEYTLHVRRTKYMTEGTTVVMYPGLCVTLRDLEMQGKVNAAEWAYLNHMLTTDVLNAKETFCSDGSLWTSKVRNTGPYLYPPRDTRNRHLYLNRKIKEFKKLGQ